ncbi:hypothetical protein ACFLVN_04745 [Chloroflexota bacterium]
MAKKLAFFMVFPDVPASREAEWNEWCDKVHIPARQTVPGIYSAQRFIALEGERKYFHFFGLNDAGVLNSEYYFKLREKELLKGDPSYGFMTMAATMLGTCSGVYEQIFPEEEVFQEPQSDTILVMGLDVPSDKEEEFNVWYNEEHIPRHLPVPGVIKATRFVSVKEELSPGCKATGPRYLTIYEVENEKVFLTPEYEKSKHSPWTSWMKRYYIPRFRSIFRRIH